jgi:hypothetical protein
MLQIKSTDTGVIFQLQKEDLMISKLLLDIYENTTPGDILEIENASTELLTYIIHFLKHYREDAMMQISRPLLYPSLDNEIQLWYQIFIKTVTEDGKLFELLKLANYFDIPPLLDLCCAHITIQQLQNSTIEEIKNEIQQNTSYNFEDEIVPFKAKDRLFLEEFNQKTF